MLENLAEFKKYIDYKITTHFGALPSKLEYFRQWELAKPYSKNHLTYSYIYNLSKNSERLIEKSGGYPFNLWKREEYNLTIGDVLAIIEEYKRLPNNINQYLDNHFCYLIKINYSIYLSSKLFQTFEKIEESKSRIEDFQKHRKLYLKRLKGNQSDKYEEKYEESLSLLIDQLPELIDYLQVINSNFMPQEFSFLDYVKGYNLNDYVLTFPTISSFNGNKDLYYKFIQMFINSEWPIHGDVSRNIARGESQFIYRRNELMKLKDPNLQLSVCIKVVIQLRDSLERLINHIPNETTLVKTKYVIGDILENILSNSNLILKDPKRMKQVV